MDSARAFRKDGDMDVIAAFGFLALIVGWGLYGEERRERKRLEVELRHWQSGQYVHPQSTGWQP
jgi:hypothetical protein